MWRRLRINNPAHNGETQTAAAFVAAGVGDAVGSPLLSNEYDPVTTEPKGEAHSSVMATPYGGDVANLQLAQYAGSWQGNVHVPSYISGYFDGEGCFSVAIAPRDTLRTGWEVRPSVSVSQNADRAQVVEEIHAYFGCGSIRADPGDKTVKWECRSLRPLSDLVLPHFRMFPLRSGKLHDVVHLNSICTIMEAGGHRSVDGVRRIVEIARVMNPSGIRKYQPDEILEDLDTR